MSARLACVNRPINRTAKVVIIYDDLVSVLSANAILGRLPLTAEAEEDAVRWGASSWQYDMLQPGILADQALAAASSASLLLLTTTGANATPEWVKQWLKRWASLHCQADTMLGLVLGGDLPEEEIHESGIADFLRQLAERHSLAFQFFRETISVEDTLAVLGQLSRPTEFLPPLSIRTSDRWSVGDAWKPAPDWAPGSGTRARTRRWRLGSALPAEQKLEIVED